jgi:hypothetical protein
MTVAGRHRSIAWLVLVVWLVGAAAPIAGALHAMGDDAACGEPQFAGHPTTQFEGVLPAADHGHCEVCHLQRTLRGASPRAPLAAVMLSSVRAEAARWSATVPAVVVPRLSGRAPPALLD